jgi:hypothetical protein
MQEPGEAGVGINFPVAGFAGARRIEDPPVWAGQG